MDVELVVTDLDGTLWHLASDVHPRTTGAITRLRDAGVPILVATGRRVRSTSEPLSELGLSPPAVVLNGALGLDLATGVRFHQGGFTAADAAVVLDAFRRHGIDPCVYVDHDDFAVCVSTAPSTHPEHLASFGSDVRSVDLAETVAAERVLGFSVLGAPESTASALAAELADIASPHLDRDRYYGGFSLTAAPPTQSKWDGVAAYCKENNVDLGAVLAMGDGPNDVELLQNAAVAVVPDDAHPSAHACADHVIGSARDGGWADVLELIGLA